MKKIAFYVEGLTEQFFINKLLIEIAGQKNIEIELRQFQGARRGHRTDIYPRTTSQPVNPQHHALILDCVGDGGVKPRILEDYQRLFSRGYSEIIGLLDLYPRADLTRFENELVNGTIINGRTITQPLPINTEIIVAVDEVESWFLSECTHFTCIDNVLTNSLIISNMNFDPCTDDMTLRSHPAMDLHTIYQLANHSYMDSQGKKRKRRIERTVECLDYADIYIMLRYRITKLNQLISKIDNFLT
ncbi:MAG: hypothetical protein GY795_51145 [Desulfobacterales bacterium]|nr:hypothetical protein [Desulfobacterales bacterium]